DGAASHVSCPSNSTFMSLTNNISIAAWFKLRTPGIPGSSGAMAARGAAGDTGYVFAIDSSHGNSVKVSKYGVVDIWIGASPADTNWHQAVVVWSSIDGTKLYLDGALSGSNADTSNLKASSDNCGIGITFGEVGGPLVFDGSLDDVRI